MSYENVPKNKTEKAVLTRGGRPDFSKLEADAFPVPTLDEAGAVLENTDTGNRFVWTGTTFIHTHNIGYPIPIEVSDRGNEAVPVFVQDQTTRALDLSFNNVVSTFQLSVPTVVGLRTFEAVAGHSIVVGNLIELINASNSDISIVTGVATNTITLDSLIGDIYPTGVDFDAAMTSMLVDGSVTPVVFSLDPVPGQIGDIVRVMFSVQSVAKMDFSTFGSITKLTNGCLLRINNGDGTFINLFNWKTNGGFTIRSLDAIYQEKVGAGAHSFIARTTFGGQDKRGVVIRLDGNLDETLEVVIQDDLTSGNTLIEMIAQGHGVQEQ